MGRARLWTLGSLGKDRAYRLEWNEQLHRWDLAELESGEPVTTREDPKGRPRPRNASRRGRPSA